MNLETSQGSSEAFKARANSALSADIKQDGNALLGIQRVKNQGDNKGTALLAFFCWHHTCTCLTPAPFLIGTWTLHTPEVTCQPSFSLKLVLLAGVSPFVSSRPTDDVHVPGACQSHSLAANDGLDLLLEEHPGLLSKFAQGCCQ